MHDGVPDEAEAGSRGGVMKLRGGGGGIGQEGCSGWGLGDQVFSINCGGWLG